MSDSTATDGAAAAVGTIAAAVTLVAAAAPAVEGTAVRTDDPAVLAGAVVAVVAVAAALARRHRLLERRTGALLGAFAGGAALLSSLYGLNRGLTDGVALPLVGPVPVLLVATIGGAAVVAAAAADYAGLSARGIYRRAAATIVFSGVGIVGFVAMQLWMEAVLAVVVSVSSGVGSVEDLAATESVLVSQAGTVLGVGSVAVGYLVASDRGWGFVDLRAPTLRDVGYVVGGFVAIMAAAAGLNALLQATGTESAGHSVVEQAEANPEMLLVLVPAAIVVIGPFEELLYRNVVQKSLYDHFSRPGAVVAASVPFAIVHAPTYSGGAVGESLVSLGVVLSLSLLLGAVYERTDNLLVPAVVHGLYNASIFLLLYLSLAA